MLQVNLGIITYNFKMDIHSFCAKHFIVYLQIITDY